MTSNLHFVIVIPICNYIINEDFFSVRTVRGRVEHAHFREDGINSYQCIFRVKTPVMADVRWKARMITIT